MSSQADTEIVQRVRDAWPDWADNPPPQSLVADIATRHDADNGRTGAVCGVARARRLRDLAATDNRADTVVFQAVTDAPDTQTPAPTRGNKRAPIWPVALLVLPAFVAIWSGWVGLGVRTGFGVINLLPGLVPDGEWSTINTAITLPIGLETYAGYGLWIWVGQRGGPRAVSFARTSTIIALVLGALGQVASHLLAVSGSNHAPWYIVVVVSCLPVIVLGIGAALAHLVRADPAP